MKILLAGDISFDWLPPSGPRQLLSSLFARPHLSADLTRDLNRAANFRGLAAWKINAQARVIGRRLSRALGHESARSDVFCANLESVLSTAGSALGDKKYTLRASPHYIETLKALGLSHVCLANNHILDFGPAALDETSRLLERAGVVGIGLRRAGASRQEPVWIERDGSKVALLNYVDPGIIDPNPEYYLSCDPSPFPLVDELVLEDVTRAARLGAVVVLAHWGEEWSFLESEKQRSLARAIIDAGAAAVVSHHTHLVGSYEEYGQGLIAYGLGNLFMMLPGFSRWRGRDRLMLELELEGGGLKGYRAVPLSNDADGYPFLDSGWPAEYLQPGHVPSALKVDSVLFDSYVHLKEGEVNFESGGRVASAVWSDMHLAPFEAVEGKLPVGPGWRIENRTWCGVARSREQFGREFAEVCVVHLDGPGELRITWDLPMGVKVLRLLNGFPEYMSLLETVTRAGLALTVNGRPVELSANREPSRGWLVEDVSSQLRLSGPGRLEVTASNATNGQAFCCFRIVVGG